MAGPTVKRLAAPALGAIAALALAASALAGVLPKPVKAELATTGSDSELRKAVPIAKQPGARDRVVMQLAPDALQTIEAGDTLRASGEVQISTTCVDPGARCIGRNYSINPTITARIVLSPSPEAAGGSLPLSPVRSALCKQQRPNRNHHCTLAIPNIDTTISDLSALPCPPDACYVNMILGAVNKKAKKGDVVVLGADRPDGTTVQDKGRLNLVQARATVPAPTVSSSDVLTNTELPLTDSGHERRRTVYSVAIPAPRKGEVLSFDSSYVNDISSLRFNTFISSRVITAESPTATDSTGIAKNAIPLRGQATESNGFNCTLGRSGFTNACTTVKAGAVRITRDVVDPTTGLPATIYLNVLASAKPLLAEKVDPSAQVTLGSLPGGLTVSRFAP
jgi:hypothetical protein